MSAHRHVELTHGTGSRSIRHRLARRLPRSTRPRYDVEAFGTCVPLSGTRPDHATDTHRTRSRSSRDRDRGNQHATAAHWPARTGHGGHPRGDHRRLHRAARPVARRAHDPRGEPGPAERGRPQGGRPPGVIGIDGLDPQRAVPPLAATRRPRRHQAPLQPGVSRPPLPDGRPRREVADDAPPVRWAPVVPVAHQGPRPDRLLDGLCRPGRRGTACSRRSPTSTCGHTSATRPSVGPIGGSWPRSGMPSSTRGTSGRRCWRIRSRASAT